MTRPLSIAGAALAALIVQTRPLAAQQLGPVGGVVLRTASQVPPSPQNGLKLGDGALLHLGVGAEAGYDTNVFYNDSDRVGSTFLRVTPSAEITNTGRAGEIPSGLFYDLRAALTYREYITDEIDASRLRAFVPTVTMFLEHNSRGSLALGLLESYVRAEEAPYTSSAGQSLIIRNGNTASAHVRWSPGGGRLQGLVRYTNTIDYFETAYLKAANSIGHEAMLDVSWRWLPKTALYFQLRQGYISYTNSSGSGMTTNLGDKYSSFPLRTVVGIRGLITEKTSVALAFGYQNAFYSNGATTSGFLGSTSAAGELVVLPLTGTRVALGARHDFQNSVIGNFFYTDGVYASVAQQTPGGLVGQFWGSYDYRRYYGLQALGAPDPRRDNMVQAGALLDYFVKSWAYVGASYTLALNRSDYQPGLMPLAGATYTKHQVFARLGITY